MNHIKEVLIFTVILPSSLIMATPLTLFLTKGTATGDAFYHFILELLS
jgi:hypothetical protein